MKLSRLLDTLERSPVIAAVHEDDFDAAVDSPCEIIFDLKANVNTVRHQAEIAHKAEKLLFVHVDLADGIGKDKAGMEYLALCGVDGIVSTRSALIRTARELGLFTVQRFFALDSQGVNAIEEMLESSRPDMMELMPGVIPKLIRRFSGAKTPLIAGGLVQTKQEVTEALSSGATAISTGTQALWHM